MRHATSSGVSIWADSRLTKAWIVVGVFALLLQCFDGPPARAESQSVTIQVIGPDHQPVPRAEASLFWQVKDGVMTSMSDESAVADATGNAVLRFDARNEKRPVLILSPDRKHGAIMGVSKADDGKERNVVLGATVRARGRLVSTELNSKPQWANTMVKPEGFNARLAQHMGNSAEFDFRLPAGKYSFTSYGSDVGNHSQAVTLVADHPELDLGTIDLKATPIAKLKGKPAPAWDVTATRGIKRTAQLSDYKGKWVFLEFWGFW